MSEPSLINQLPRQTRLRAPIVASKQVLLLERQVLKRRVKRDFLELGANQAPAALGTRLGAAAAQADPAGWPSLAALAGGASEGPAQVRLQPHTSPQQQQQLQLQQAHLSALGGQARPHVQQAKPGLMRIPAHHHYTRPANQAVNPHPQRVATGRLLAEPAPYQQESLETAATGSSLLYQQLANGLAASQPSSAAAKGANASIAAGGQRAPFANGTSGGNKQMPFNDPSWPLMWYLVSTNSLICSYLSVHRLTKRPTYLRRVFAPKNTTPMASSCPADEQCDSSCPEQDPARRIQFLCETRDWRAMIYGQTTSGAARPSRALRAHEGSRAPLFKSKSQL